VILIFGSINVDVIVPVPRLPMPGETVLGGDYALLPGGKGATAGVRCDFVPDELLRPDTVLVAQMEVPPSETAGVIRRVRARAGRCVLNLAPAFPIDAQLLPDIDLIVANEGEALSLGVRSGAGRAPSAPRARRHPRCGGRHRLPRRRRDPGGAVTADRSGRHNRRRRHVCRRAGRRPRPRPPIETALRRACVAAGLACLARGAQTAMPDAAAIDTAMARSPPG
jgi:ribokinase